jgi:hypothetical protein
MYRFLRIVHRVTGLIGAIIVLLMAISGLLLNHRSFIGYNSDAEMKLQNFIFGLHSGTVGNVSIVWITDFGAICMIVLSISGIWMWVNTRMTKHNQLKRRKNHHE